MSDRASIDRLVAHVVERHGGLNVLVTAAARFTGAPIEEMDFEEHWRGTLATELDAVFLLCQAAWPHLRAAGGASIINFASVNARLAADGLPTIVHAAGKAGVLGMTRELAKEGAEHAIRANTIAPGVIKTGATSRFLDAIPPAETEERVMSTVPTDATGASATSGCPYDELAAAAPRCPAVHGEPFNPFDQKQADNPYPWAAAARKEAPVFYMPELDIWCVTRWDDVLEVMRDDETFSSRNAITPKELEGPLAEVFPDGHPIRHSLLLKDPPEHTRVRKLVQKNFTPTAIARYEDMVRERANALVDAFIDDGHCDLVAQFTGPLPVQVVCDIIGIPDGEVQNLARWADDTMLMLKGAPELSPEEQQALADRAAPVMDWLYAFVDERRERPREDLTSELLLARTDGGEPLMTTDQVVGFIDSLLIAGVGTTKNFIALATRELLSHPDQWEQIKADRSLLANALEECLRLRTPSRGSRRTAMRDVTIGGVTIPKGAAVQIMLFSPQRDETVFEDPDRLDIHRENAKKHFAFGRWTHMCLGSNLAKLEARVAFEIFLDRLPGMRLVPDQEWRWVPNMTIAEFRSLLVEWD